MVKTVLSGSSAGRVLKCSRCDERQERAVQPENHLGLCVGIVIPAKDVSYSRREYPTPGVATRSPEPVRSVSSMPAPSTAHLWVA